jgi:hypothetical protein
MDIEEVNRRNKLELRGCDNKKKWLNAERARRRWKGLDGTQDVHGERIEPKLHVGVFVRCLEARHGKLEVNAARSAELVRPETLAKNGWEGTVQLQEASTSIGFCDNNKVLLGSTLVASISNFIYRRVFNSKKVFF